MGTRRSKHHKGRKPFYKDHRRTGIRNSDLRDRGLGYLTGHRLPPDESGQIWERFLDHLQHMSALSVAKLPGMPSAAAFNVRRQTHRNFKERATTILSSRTLNNSGRPRIVAEQWLAFSTNLKRMPIFLALDMPDAPSAAAVYKRRRKDPDFRALMDTAPNGRLGYPKNYPARRRDRVQRAEIVLNYPYIIRARPEHAEILEVNCLIPTTITGDRRADICQEILLALIEGRVTMQQLRIRRDDTVFFIRKFWRDNFEQSGNAVSFDRGDDERTYDEIASSIAAKEWHAGQVNDRRRYFDAMLAFQPPTQIDDVYLRQLHRRHAELAHLGLSVDDVEAELSID